jgi:protein-S-isoprenylcysteine O-methyltransferase Ste14
VAGNQQTGGGRNSADQAKLVGLTIAGALLLLFFFQNLQTVSIHFLWIDMRIDMIWALVLSAGLGAATMYFAMWYFGRAKSKGAG